MSLTEARPNYSAFGASEIRFITKVRAAGPPKR
ncbi:CPCC family cysteine-rich protein [Sinorhizobium meliloti]|nr:hypothetical protein CN070_28095 [Sinorhizobium meliloti]